ncbi:hypothetical protein [Bradyrhizobium sp. SZCCHNR1045]|uniref:hypothetical protein n=1 Tax=Bradyrhizobium sp. SZCCHNR1045 TaxID=3057353 RepID=UPI00291624BD|nr:hypothetical protein [Bradyrhizobium sp. SZCCHNR1045]
MSIKSHAFGRVTLTGQDARKFKNQVVYGKAKPAATKSVKSGVGLVRKMQAKGTLTLSKSSSGRLVARKD